MYNWGICVYGNRQTISCRETETIRENQQTSLTSDAITVLQDISSLNLVLQSWNKTTKISNDIHSNAFLSSEVV